MQALFNGYYFDFTTSGTQTASSGTTENVKEALTQAKVPTQSVSTGINKQTV